MSQDGPRLQVAIVDYGLGNLFSVGQACARAGLTAEIIASPEEILSADAVILPGVGAFGDAMEALRRLDLVSVLRDAAASGKPMLGVCLGAQLLLEESEEFGAHRGLGILPGRVVAFDNPRDGNRRLKVPQVGWNRIHRPQGTSSDFWQDTLLDGRSDGEFMYFVHSFILQPDDSSVILSTSCYGDVTFCSSLVWRSITAFQFHPERSGFSGLQVYRNLALQVQQAQKEINPR